MYISVQGGEKPLFGFEIGHMGPFLGDKFSGGLLFLGKTILTDIF